MIYPINLSEEAIDNISPQEIYDFTLNNHFDELTINWFLQMIILILFILISQIK